MLVRPGHGVVIVARPAQRSLYEKGLQALASAFDRAMADSELQELVKYISR